MPALSFLLATLPIILAFALCFYRIVFIFSLLLFCCHIFFWRQVTWHLIPCYLGVVIALVKATFQRSFTPLPIWACVPLAAFSLLFVVLLPIWSFPRLGGPFRVGTCSFQWVDHSRSAWFPPFAPNATLAKRLHRRDIMVSCWYPCTDEKPPAPAECTHWIHNHGSAVARSFMNNVPYLFLSHFPELRSRSRLHGDLRQPVEGERPYPIVVFSHGSVVDDRRKIKRFLLV